MGLFFFSLVVLGKKKNDFNGFRYFTLAVNRAVDGFLLFLRAVGAAAL